MNEFERLVNKYQRLYGTLLQPMGATEDQLADLMRTALKEMRPITEAEYESLMEMEIGDDEDPLDDGEDVF